MIFAKNTSNLWLTDLIPTEARIPLSNASKPPGFFKIWSWPLRSLHCMWQVVRPWYVSKGLSSKSMKQAKVKPEASYQRIMSQDSFFPSVPIHRKYVSWTFECCRSHFSTFQVSHPQVLWDHKERNWRLSLLRLCHLRQQGFPNQQTSRFKLCKLVYRGIVLWHLVDMSLNV